LYGPIVIVCFSRRFNRILRQAGLQLRILIVLVVAYLIGSIPSGYLIVRATEGEDIRETGSGGTGATNVSRRAGKGAGVMTLILDVLKGALAVFVTSHFSEALFPYADWTIAAAGVLAIVGHIFPIWLRFRGGKGVATGLGVFLMLAPVAVGVALVVFAVTFALTRYVSLASIVCIASIAIISSMLTLIDPFELPTAVSAIVAAGLIIFAHRENIQRLRTGAEPKFE
jgi:glycerol-3-phosphate acyltransferase PlsY